MKYVIGNWKMNGDAKLLDDFASLAGDGVALCVPFHLLGEKTPMELGAEDCSLFKSGPYTGDVSADMIAATGAKYCIVGHSDRRARHNETNEQVRTKAERALEAGLTPIICVGENAELRKAGETLRFVESQLRESLPADAHGFIVAYEPIWAISNNLGSGMIPTDEDIKAVHNHIAAILAELGYGGTAILYGGSANPQNAAGIMAIENVGGVLVGAKSLNAQDFKGIIDAR